MMVVVVVVMMVVVVVVVMVRVSKRIIRNKRTCRKKHRHSYHS
jgi:NADH:ubiquinone oxidoreductase subunit 3 (subunit A)